MVAVLAVGAVACGSSSGSAATTAATSAPTTSAAPDTTLPSTTVAVPEAATGGDSQTAEGKLFVAALMAQPSQDSGFTDAERQCISEATIDVIGVKALDDAGVTPEAVTANTGDSFFPNFTMSDSMSDGVVAAMFQCADMGAFLLKAATANGTLNLPADKAKCFTDALAKSPEAREVFKVGRTGADSTAAQTALQNAVLPMAVSCNITTTELAGAFGS